MPDLPNPLTKLSDIDEPESLLGALQNLLPGLSGLDDTNAIESFLEQMSKDKVNRAEQDKREEEFFESMLMKDIIDSSLSEERSDSSALKSDTSKLGAQPNSTSTSDRRSVVDLVDPLLPGVRASVRATENQALGGRPAGGKRLPQKMSRPFSAQKAYGDHADMEIDAQFDLELEKEFATDDLGNELLIPNSDGEESD